MKRDEVIQAFDALIMTVATNEVAKPVAEKVKQAYLDLEKGVELGSDPLALLAQMREAARWEWKCNAVLADIVYSRITRLNGLGDWYLQAALERNGGGNATEDQLSKALATFPKGKR